eukprot:scaffold733_cov52-Phaeocystis_antarctica.AAC.2
MAAVAREDDLPREGALLLLEHDVHLEGVLARLGMRRHTTRMLHGSATDAGSLTTLSISIHDLRRPLRDVDDLAAVLDGGDDVLRLRARLEPLVRLLRDHERLLAKRRRLRVDQDLEPAGPIAVELLVERLGEGVPVPGVLSVDHAALHRQHQPYLGIDRFVAH